MRHKKFNRLRYVWKFGRKYIPFFLIAEICILVSYGVSILLPINLTRLTDEVLYGGEYNAVSICFVTQGKLTVGVLNK